MYLPIGYVTRFRLCERMQEHFGGLIGVPGKVSVDNPISSRSPGLVVPEFYDGLRFFYSGSPAMVSGGFSLCKYETNCGIVLGSRLVGNGRTSEESSLLTAHMFRWAMRASVEFGFTIFTWSLNERQPLHKQVMLDHGMNVFCEENNRRSGNKITLYGRILPPVGDPQWIKWGIEKPLVPVPTEVANDIPVGIVAEQGVQAVAGTAVPAGQEVPAQAAPLSGAQTA